jgi:hypothetical protein
MLIPRGLGVDCVGVIECRSTSLTKKRIASLLIAPMAHVTALHVAACERFSMPNSRHAVTCASHEGS